jgi:hypothetical protein
VINPYKRFPRSSLFSKAAQLQNALEYWMGITAQHAADADEHGWDQAKQKLDDRYAQLAEARRRAAECRQALFDVL